MIHPQNIDVILEKGRLCWRTILEDTRLRGLVVGARKVREGVAGPRPLS